jgi:hypothetical protein
VDMLVVGLRIVHIGSSVLWVGAAALYFFYIEPAMREIGRDAEKFATEMMDRRRVPIYFGAISTISVLAGAALYWRDSHGLDPAWISSSTGLAYTVGGLAALAAWIGGSLLFPLMLSRVAAIGASMTTAGVTSAELAGPLRRAEGRLHAILRADIVLLGVSVVAMAAARGLG